jgi:ABC-type branched-subunit amino acid transport system ATPase component
MRLEVDRLSAGYGQTIIVREVTLDLRSGETLAIVGRNGMGKTTLLKGLLGYLGNPGGAVRLDGQDVRGWPTFQIIRLGVAYAPQEQAVVGELSVAENLESGALASRPSTERRSQIMAYFPLLGQRLRQRAGTLSGGEQKMLILARALLAEPRLLVLDEISAGLQPAIRDVVVQALTHERSRRGLTLLMVEQNIDMVIALANRVAVMKLGQLVWDCPAREEYRDRLNQELSL